MTLDEAERTIEIWRKYEVTKPGTDRTMFLYGAEHDQVYGGPDPILVSEEDVTALEALGWHSLDDCFTAFV
jgi:hypothetical protein